MSKSVKRPIKIDTSQIQYIHIQHSYLYNKISFFLLRLFLFKCLHLIFFVKSLWENYNFMIFKWKNKKKEALDKHYKKYIFIYSTEHKFKSKDVWKCIIIHNTLCIHTYYVCTCICTYIILILIFSAFKHITMTVIKIKITLGAEGSHSIKI